MKDNRIKGIIALALVTVVAFGIIFASRSLVNVEDNGENDDTVVEGLLDVTGYEGVDSAWEVKDDSGNVTGYAVKASARGFSGPVLLQVDFELDGKTIKSVTPVSHNETEGYGSKMEEPDYLGQFPGVEAPVHFEGESAQNVSDEVIKLASVVDGATLGDGIYTAETDDFIGGYKFMITIKVEDGKITSVVWDAMDELGQWKSYLSATGQYVMNETGLTWKEQADALASYVIENQSVTAINVDEEGHTDSVSGVSISINEFIDLTSKALEEAAGVEPTDNTGTDNNGTDSTTGGSSQIDAISGATASSVAIKEAINRAYAFINDYVNK